MNKTENFEKIVLGSCFHDEKFVPWVVYELEVSDFTQETNRRIFEAIKNLHHEKKPVNLSTVSNKSEIKGSTIIDECIDSYKDGMDVAYCIAEVKHNGEKKRMEEILVRSSLALSKDELSLEEVKEDLRAIISPKLSGKITIEDVYDPARMLKTYKDHVKNLKQNLFKTGFVEIDKKIRGVAGGEVLTIIARAGAFKTAMLQNMLRNYIHSSGMGALFYSLEMPVSNLTERFISMIEQWDGSAVEAAFKNYDSNEVGKGVEKRFIPDLENLFVVSKKISLSDIQPCIDLIEDKHGTKIGAVGIDYLGLIDGPGASEYEVVSNIARGTKDVAKMINLPVVILSQTNRKAGEGETEVSLDMGRGSGAIEEGADFVLGLWTVEDEKDPSRYDLICRILKNRKGEKGSRWKLNVTPKNFRFDSHAESYTGKPDKRKAFNF